MERVRDETTSIPAWLAHKKSAPVGALLDASEKESLFLGILVVAHFVLGCLRCGSCGIASLLGFRLDFCTGVVGGSSNLVTRHSSLRRGGIGGGFRGIAGSVRCVRGILGSCLGGGFGSVGLRLGGGCFFCIISCAVAGGQGGSGGEGKYE